jgi:hypothetical protein
VKKRTLSDVIDRYLEVTLPRAKHRKNADEQTRLLEVWRSELGRVALAKLTPAVVAEARDKLAERRNRAGKPLTGSTVNRHLTALSGVLRVAVREYGWLARNPVANVTKFEDSKGRERFLSDAERIRLVDECKAPAQRDIFEQPDETLVCVAEAVFRRRSHLRSIFANWDIFGTAPSIFGHCQQ